MRALVGVLLLLPATAFCWSYEKEDVATYFDSAEAVARVKVLGNDIILGYLDEHEVYCGIRVRAKIVESLKGSFGSVEFFSFADSYEVNKEYLVFLQEMDTRHRRVVDEEGVVLSHPTTEPTSACDGMLPRLSSHPGARSEFVCKWSHERRACEPWIVAARGIDVPEDTPITFQIFELDSVLINGERVDDAAKRLLKWEFPVPCCRLAYVESIEWESYKNFISDALAPR